MTFQTSTVTVVSDNPKYPNNKITVTVDNDLNPTSTIVIPNTTFPYIIEFVNCAEAVDKRYISEWLFQKLLLAYSTDSGKISNTLQKEFSPYPYLTLDYQLFRDKILQEQNLFKYKLALRPERYSELISTPLLKQTISTIVQDVQEIEITLLDDVGASISSMDTISPVFIIKWLSLPLVTGEGDSVKSFPSLLSFQNKIDIDISYILKERKISDFFATTYITDINYPLQEKIEKDSQNTYNKYVEDKGNNYFDGDYSRQNKFQKILNNNRIKSIDSILSKTQNIGKSLLGGASLIAAAAGLKQKLDSLKSLSQSVRSLPKPGVKFNAILVTAKIKKAEQKPKKKKRLSGRKSRPPVEINDIKNPAVESLKTKAGSLSSAAAATKNAALAQQKAVTEKLSGPIKTGVFYTITPTVNTSTISLTVENNFGAPTFKVDYSAVTYTVNSAKENLQSQLDMFGYYDSVNGSYPKSGSPISS